MDIVKNMQAEFKKNFGDQATSIFFSPGRVNLIGEHTDYNGGNVFPCAISLGTYAVAAKRMDKKMRLYSMNIPEKGVIEFEIASLSYDKKI
jgi:galactokinase